MKNVDVPMWDKGDDTDSFSKGGASGSFSFSTPTIKNTELKEIYMLVLGREPSSREMAQQKYSPTKRNDLIVKLVESDEHSKVLDRSKEHPTLKDDLSGAKSKILKLKTLVSDQESEFLELKRLILEKNSMIESLRENKDVPFLTDRTVLEEKNMHYSTSSSEREEREDTIWDRILNIFYKSK